MFQNSQEQFIIKFLKGAKNSLYKKFLKRFLDILISLIAIIVLSVPMLLIALIIKIDSKGPVIFKQKRIGLHKTHFMIYKFRSMKTDVPHDIPTHLLKNSESYMTKWQRFMRKASLDELPQLFNILKGDMSIIGPRPALWNQFDLIAERDKYGANDVVPGLTGLAQISGRDELGIPIKAKLDGEYAANLTFLMDLKCFLGTISAVITRKGFLEGRQAEETKEAKDETIVL